MRLKFITFDLENKTIEVTWEAPQYDYNGQLVEYIPIKSRNYSMEEKEDFLKEVENAQAFINAIGW